MVILFYILKSQNQHCTLLSDSKKTLQWLRFSHMFHSICCWLRLKVFYIRKYWWPSVVVPADPPQHLFNPQNIGTKTFLFLLISLLFTCNQRQQQPIKQNCAAKFTRGPCSVEQHINMFDKWKGVRRKEENDLLVHLPCAAKWEQNFNDAIFNPAAQAS